MRRPRGLAILLLALAVAAPGVAAGATPLPGFQVIMWQTRNARQYQTLRALGVTAARVQADRDGETPSSAAQKVAPIVQAGLRPYVENIATDFYAAYHRWTPGKPDNWRFLALQARIAENPQDRSALLRQPSLSDRHALRAIEARLTRTVQAYARFRPLFFNLGDETGIADLSAAWDFDYSPPSLAALRTWLRQRYGTLAALNREWQTEFARWQDVVPPTTTETIARTDGNYAAWSDFKAFMDSAFASAVRAGSDAVHRGAPWARAAIEGAQMPGWGGYDYARLAPAVDVMELYDAGESLALAQSFNPTLTILTTARWGEPEAPHQAWREFLRGARGMILWDPDDRLVNPDGTVGPDGQRAAPFLAAMRQGIGPLIATSRRVFAPVAVLYSPESFRIQWLLDHRHLQGSWTRLGSGSDQGNDAVRSARHRIYRMLMQQGLAPHFISDRQLADGQLRYPRDKVLILPQALALSQASAQAIRSFVGRGGTLVVDGPAGLFDGHGRRVPAPPLSRLLVSGNPRVATLPTSDGQAAAILAQHLAAAGVVGPASIDGPTGRIEEYTYRHGRVTLVALLSDMPAGAATTRARLQLPRTADVYDLGARRFLGRQRHVTADVGGATPTILALTDAPLAGPDCLSLFQGAPCPDIPHPRETR